jgi:hypothetical protein
MPSEKSVSQQTEAYNHNNWLDNQGALIIQPNESSFCLKRYDVGISIDSTTLF